MQGFGYGKTIAGAIIVAAGAFCGFMGYTDYQNTIIAVGAALGLVGIGHKIERLVNKL